MKKGLTLLSMLVFFNGLLISSNAHPEHFGIPVEKVIIGTECNLAESTMFSDETTDEKIIDAEWKDESSLKDDLVLHDIGITKIHSPVSGFGLGDEELLMVSIGNFGNALEKFFPISFQLNGGDIVTELIPNNLYPGETMDYVFSQHIDLSQEGLYWIEACTGLGDDENNSNNCQVSVVESFGPGFCKANTSLMEEYISYVIFGDIYYESAWQDGVDSQLELVNNMAPGMFEDLYFVNENPHELNAAAAWVDWNKDEKFNAVFGEVYPMTHDGTGAIFTTPILVPLGTLPGTYRMRIRLVREGQPQPCGVSDYGELEEYSIEVSGDMTPTTDHRVNSLNIYPNPASGFTRISADKEIQKLEVLDMNGQFIMLEYPATNEWKLNTAQLEPGMYVVRTWLPDGLVISRLIVGH